VGYPQQLRILLGIGKLAGAIVLLMPRLPTLKEWAYAGFTFMWIAAVVAHYLASDGALSLLPVVLLESLAVSYVTRSANRGGSAKGIPMKRQLPIVVLALAAPCLAVGQTTTAPPAKAATVSQPKVAAVPYGSNAAAGKTFVHDGVTLYYEVYGQANRS
jgi:DoxX-like family